MTILSFQSNHLNRDVMNFMAMANSGATPKDIDKAIGGVARRNLVIREAERRNLIRIERTPGQPLSIEIIEPEHERGEPS